MSKPKKNRPVPPPEAAPAEPAQPRQPRHPQPRAIHRGAWARIEHARMSTRMVLDVLHNPHAGGDRPHTPEWPSVIAEMHARLLEPDGCTLLGNPSPYVAGLLRNLEELPGWDAIRRAAKASPQAALRATMEIAKLIPDQRPDDVPETPEELQQQADAARDAALQLAEQGQHEAAQEAMKLHDDARAKAGMASGVRGSTIADARVAVHGASQRIEKETAGVRDGAAAAAGLLAGSAPGISSPLDVPMDLAESLGRSARVLEALRKAGAWLRAARGLKSHKLPGREGMLGPGVGGLEAVADLTSVERAAVAGMLGDGARLLSTLRLVTGRAAKTEKGGGEGQRGSIVIALDCSGSMMHAKRYEKAVAVTLALCLDRLQRGARAVVLPFDNRLRNAYAPKDVADLLRSVTHEPWMPNGGTDGITSALNQAASRARDLDDGADVLCITDGFWPSNWRRPRHLERLLVASIGGAEPPGGVADVVWKIDDSDEDGMWINLVRGSL